MNEINYGKYLVHVAYRPKAMSFISYVFDEYDLSEKFAKEEYDLGAVCVDVVESITGEVVIRHCDGKKFVHGVQS